MTRPNVLFIVADDLGYGDIGVFGDGSAQTPNLDDLVGQGITLTQHYSASPVCAPARAALLTGRYSHRTGAIDTLEGRGLDRLSLGEKTIGDILRAQGYVTGLIGKWHNGALDPRYHPNRRGFGEFVGFSGGWSDYLEWRLDRNGRFEESDGRYLTDVFADEAIAFLRRHGRPGGKTAGVNAAPFALYLMFNAPHFPYQAPVDDAREFHLSGKYSPRVATLYGMIRRLDSAIGWVLEELDTLGLAENTLVVFTSDNGPDFGSEGEESARRYNANLAGSKCSVLEGGLRVPAVVRYPEGLGEGPGLPEEGFEGVRLYDGFTHFCDWLPTILEIAGIDSGGKKKGSGLLPLDGASFYRALRGKSAPSEPRRFWQWNRYTPVGFSNAAMRDGRYKFVRPAIAETMALSETDIETDRALKYEPELIDEITTDPEPERQIPETLPRPLLFDLAADPGETTDLFDKEPERAAKMLLALEEWFQAVEAEREKGIEIDSR